MLCRQLRAELKERDIAGLTAQLDQLEQLKHRQAGQIESLRQSKDELDQQTGQASNTVRRLTDELNKVKVTLHDLSNRHRQVRTYGTSTFDPCP